MIINGKNLFLRGCFSLAVLATAGAAPAQDTTMRSVDHKDYQLQVPANWESFDTETADGGLIQIFYDPDLKAEARQCMLESSTHKLTPAELESEAMKSPWQQKKWQEVLPHVADASNVAMKDSSLSENTQGDRQHVGEFTFYASRFFWHSKSYVMHSGDRLVNLTCSASSHNSPLDAQQAFQQISPMVKRIAGSISKTK